MLHHAQLVWRSPRWDKKGHKLEAQLLRMIRDIGEEQQMKLDEERERKLWVARCKRRLLERKMMRREEEEQRKREENKAPIPPISD